MYLTYVAVEARGHEVIRTSIAHCELNPITIKWIGDSEVIRDKIGNKF